MHRDRFDLLIHGLELCFEILEEFEFGGQDRGRRPGELPAEPSEPSSVRFGPVRGVTIHVTLTQEKPVDPQLGHFDLLGSSDMCANQIPDGLLFLVGNMNGCEQSAAVEFDQVDRIPAIGFLPITSTSGDQGRGDDLAGETILLEDSMDDKSTAGGFVTHPHRTPFRKSADKFAELIEICPQTSHLGIGSLVLDNGSGD